MEPLTDEEYRQKIAAFVENAHGHAKHCARSAVRHMIRALKLKDDDPEMAAFRALTAEEEAASALFHSLKRHRYKLSEQLKPRDHIQKASVYPFFLAVEGMLAKGVPREANPQLEIDESGVRPQIRIKVRDHDKEGILRWVYPVPPLHFNIHIDNKLTDFSEELTDLASRRNAKTIIDYVRRRANRRNQLLFASDKGVPNIEGIDEFVSEQNKITYAILSVFLMVDPYPKKQNFVEQCLNAFLKMLKLFPKEFSV